MAATIELSVRPGTGDDLIDKRLIKWFGFLIRDCLVDHGDSVVIVESHSTCGPAGRQTFDVAVVIEPWSENPGLVFRNPTTVGLAEKVVAFIKTRPWEN